MATYDYQVTITDQTSGTVTLTSSPFNIRNWAPEANEYDIPTVDNELDIRVTDGSVAANLDEIRTLQKLLRQAKERQKNHTINPVYITWKENASADLYRSEIVAAKANFDETALHYGYWTGDTQFPLIELTRKNYWEGPEAQIPLTNPNGTANTSGLTVYNCNDGSGGTRYNYVDIAGTSVAGDLPGMTRLEATNNYASGTAMLDLWIGQNWTDPSNFNHWLEAESGTTGGTASASAIYSGGTAISIGVTSGTETTIVQWSLSSADLNAAKGAFYKGMVNFALGGYPNHRFKFRILRSGILLWESDWIMPESGIFARLIRDIATFQIPPWLPGQTGLYSLDLQLRAYQTTGTSSTIRCDYVQLTPIDGWRYIKVVGYGVYQNRRVVDDGINGLLYHDDGAGSDKIGELTGYGSPIKLRPGVNQRLYFLMHDFTENIAKVDRTVSLKLYYRPRRLSL